MPEESSPKQKHIEDKREALEGAYAEKPFRDALSKQREDLHPAAQAGLEWIATKEGEEAMKNWRESKGKEQEEARAALRKKIIEGIRAIPEKVKLTEKGSEFLADALQARGERQIDEILNSNIAPEQKTEQLKYLEQKLALGATAADTVEGPIELLLSKRQVQNEMEPQITREEANMLWGMFFTKLLKWRVYYVSAFLNYFTKVTGETQDSIFEQVIPLLERYQTDLAVDESTASPSKFEQMYNREEVNKAMEEFGYVWDKETNKYKKLN